MVKQPPLQNSEEQILGEIETKIVGMQYHDADVEPGEAVNLEREPDNSHDEHAVRAENGRFQTVGHLPRKLVFWLAPLLDAGKVRVDGCVPETAEENRERSPTTRSLILTVFLCKKGKTLLEKTQIHGKLDALHEVVRRAYEDIQDYSDAELILELAVGCGAPATREGRGADRSHSVSKTSSALASGPTARGDASGGARRRADPVPAVHAVGDVQRRVG